MTTDLRKIRSKAPTRIDLSGGTLDIWPLYLFLKRPITINLGIDLFAETELSETDTPGVTLVSEDQGAELKYDWNQIDAVAAPPSLVLHHRLLKLFYERRRQAGHHSDTSGIVLKTRAKSPAGAGLGGSSTLSVSMVGALATWASTPGTAVNPPAGGWINTAADGESFIEIVRDVETTVIQVPAGLQDYYGAMFGGLQVLEWLPGRHQRHSFPAELVKEVSSRLLLFYSGQSRNSGINNWALFKAFIDRTGIDGTISPQTEGMVNRQFEQIASATRKLERAIQERNWENASGAIAEEWTTRRGLARGISTKEMDFAFSLARDAGAPSGKVCGAGGGGCFFIFLPSGDPGLKDKIRKQIVAQGIRHLDFQGVAKGLTVEVSPGA